MDNPLTEPELTEILRYRVKPLMREGEELKKRRLYWRAHAKYYAALRELRLALKYREVAKSSRMMVARGIERRIVSNLQEIEDRIRGRRERVSNPFIRGLHGKWSFEEALDELELSGLIWDIGQLSTQAIRKLSVMARKGQIIKERRIWPWYLWGTARKTIYYMPDFSPESLAETIEAYEFRDLLEEG